MIIDYTINGTAAGDQTWDCHGTIDNADWNDHDLLGRAMQDSFIKLTQGKAVFGKPGVGCRGPYKIISFKLALVKS